MSKIITVKEFLQDVQVLAIVCNQWGDTGKGKFVDYFASKWADLIVRGTGGANAGHTIEIDGQSYVFHLTPSGIMLCNEGKTSVIGNGVAFSPEVFDQELRLLDEHGVPYQNKLFISHRAKLDLVQHRLMDWAWEHVSAQLEGGNKRVGTTGRGIGPTYADFVSRFGLTLNDLLNKDAFAEGLKKDLAQKVTYLKGLDPDLVKEKMHSEKLGGGMFYSNKRNIFDLDAILGFYMKYQRKLSGMIKDTDAIVKRSLEKGDNLLLEGAQGLLLSILYGTYPYVTSSDCSIEGLASGCGLTLRDVDLTLGIVKAPYMTRVGEGPFPTEFGGKKSSKRCGDGQHTLESELREYNIPFIFDGEKIKYDHNHPKIRELMKSDDSFSRGMGIRFAGHEYGATTGRPRRCGRLDLPLLRYAMGINGKEIVLSKPDVLDGCEEIEICDYYIYEGPMYRVGGRTLNKGDMIDIAIPDARVLEHCKPHYVTHDGWCSDISDVKVYSDFPRKFRGIVDYIERSSGGHIRAVSVAPGREKMILRAAKISND